MSTTALLRRLRSSLPLAACLLAAPLAAATDLVVDDGGGPGVDFTDIQPAVDAAAPGDRILVNNGTYGPFTITNKTLTVEAVGANAKVAGKVRLRQSTAGTTMRVVGLKIDSDEEGLLIRNNAGNLSVEGCTVTGGDGSNFDPPGYFDGYPAVHVDNTAALKIRDCVLTGGYGADIWEEDFEFFTTNGGNGLTMDGSNVYVYGSTVTGGKGGFVYDTTPDEGGAGGHGARMVGGYLYARNASFTGGQGGFSDCDLFFCGNGGRGGDGLRLESGAPLAHYTTCTFAGGVGGAAGGPGGFPGPPGIALNVLDGQALELAGVGEPECFGDGSGAACPCGNLGAPGEGCLNSTGVGALLGASGTNNVVFDDLVLELTQARPDKTGVFLQGATAIANPFNDGVLCVGNPTERLEFVTLDAAGAAETSVSIVTEGLVSPGDTRWYQSWFRDGMGPCGNGSNLSNGLRIEWR